MAERKYLIKTPELCEYIFHVLATTPKEVIRELTTQEMSYFKDHKAMRRFADNESFEKTAQLFGKIGIPLTIFFGKRHGWQNVIEEIGTQYQFIEKRKAIIEAMAREKLFALAGTDILTYTYMAAQNSHSRVYVLSYEYVKVKEKVMKAAVQSKNEDMRDARDAFEMMSRAILQTMIKADHTQAMSNVLPYEMKILLAIFPEQHTFVPINKIAEQLDESKRVRGVVKTCTTMANKGLIKHIPMKDPRNNHQIRSYTITEKGITAVMSFISNITKKAFYG